MAGVTLDTVRKIYAGNVEAVKGVSLEFLERRRDNSGDPVHRAALTSMRVVRRPISCARVDSTTAWREVKGVHAEVAHAPVLPVEAGTALPVDRLAAVEVAGVQEVVLDLDRLAERAGGDGLAGELGAREEGHLTRAPDEGARFVDRLDDALGGGQVDAERLLGEEVLAGRGGVEVELLVQVVGDGEVEDVDRVVVEHPRGDHGAYGLQCVEVGGDERLRVGGVGMPRGEAIDRGPVQGT